MKRIRKKQQTRSKRRIGSHNQRRLPSAVGMAGKENSRCTFLVDGLNGSPQTILISFGSTSRRRPMWPGLSKGKVTSKDVYAQSGES